LLVTDGSGGQDTQQRVRRVAMSHDGGVAVTTLSFRLRGLSGASNDDRGRFSSSFSRAVQKRYSV